MTYREKMIELLMCDEQESGKEYYYLLCQFLKGLRRYSSSADATNQALNESVSDMYEIYK